MDMTTGKKFARNIAAEDRGRYRNFASKTAEEAAAVPALVPASAVAVGTQGEAQALSESTDASATESGTAASAEGTDAEPSLFAEAGYDGALPADTMQMAEALMGLPIPEMELEEAIRRKLPPEELQALIRRVWERRQAELKEAFASAKTEAQQMQELLVRLLEPAAHGLDAQGVAAVLEDLEFFVSTVHNAEDLRGMGGFLPLVQLLNHSDNAIAAGAAWTLGTAVKGQRGLQDSAIELGALPALVQLLQRSLERSASSPSVLQQLKLTNKALYALAGLARYNRLAQEQLVDLGGLSSIADTIEMASKIASDSSLDAKLRNTARTTIAKCLTLVADMVEDQAIDAVAQAEAQADAASLKDGEVASAVFRVRTRVQDGCPENETDCHLAARQREESAAATGSGPAIVRLERDPQRLQEQQRGNGSSRGSLLDVLRSDAGNLLRLCQVGKAAGTSVAVVAEKESHEASVARAATDTLATSLAAIKQLCASL
jgi:hypothetical protein